MIETYLCFLGLPSLPKGINATAARAQSTIFFIKVWMCVRWTASPKHPQSITGLKMTRAAVSKVKKARNAEVTYATALRHTPVASAAPVRASASAASTPTVFAEKSRKPK